MKNSSNPLYGCLLFLALCLPAPGDDIHIAAYAGNLDRVQQILFTNQALLNLTNAGAYTPLHMAARSGNTNLLQFLLDAGASLNQTNYQGHPPIFCALHDGKLHTAAMLIHSNADFSGIDFFGFSAIHQAAFGGNPRLIDLILSKGADINAKSVPKQITPVFLAASQNKIEGLKFLIGKKADIAAPDIEGDTPLHIAAHKGRFENAQALIAAGADPNTRNKLGFKPLDLVTGKTNDALAALLAQHTAGTWKETATGKVGELGDPSLLIFQGNSAISTSAIRNSLTVNPGYLLAAHPQAQMKPFLDLLKQKLIAGYATSGFPDAKADVSYDEPAGRIKIHIQEGPRFTAGDVLVSGAPKDLVAELRKRLTTWPETSAELIRLQQTFKKDSSSTSTNSDFFIKAGINTDTNPSKTPPAWEPGTPAHFDPAALLQIECVIRNVSAGSGYLFPKFQVSPKPVQSTGKATLNVAFQELGPPGIIVDVALEGNKTHSRAEILKYLDLRSGTRLNAKLFRRIEERLLNSGRFLNWAINPMPAPGPENAPGGILLKLHLRENQDVPKLSEKLSPEQETLIKCARWLAGFKQRSEDLVLTVHPSTKGYLPAGVGGSVIFTPQGECLMNLTPAPDSRSIPPLTAIAAIGQASIYFPNSGAKFEAADPGLALQAFINFFPAEPTPDNPLRWNLSMGAGFSSNDDSHRPPAHLSVDISPAAMIGLAHDAVTKISRGKLLITNEDVRMIVDTRTGRLDSLDLVDPELMGSVRFQRGAFKQTAQRLRDAASTLKNQYRPGHGLTTLATFSAAQALHIYATANTNNFPGVLQPAISALEKLTANSLLHPLDDLVNSDESDKDHFSLPRDQVDFALAQNSLATMFSGIAFKYCDKMFPRYSWPWTLARESVFIMGGQGTYADAEMQRLYNSDQTGPIGCLVIAKFFRSFNPKAAKTFALRGLTRLSAEDFLNDCNLFLKPGGGLGESFTVFTQNLAALTSEEVEALATVLPSNEASLLRDSAAALEKDSSRSLATALSPALEQYWTRSLRAEIRAALQTLAFERPEPQTANKL